MGEAYINPQPIPTDETEADLWGRRAEEVLAQIRGMSASLFTAGELIYVQHWTSKVRWGGPAEREKGLFEKWSALKTDLESRAATLGDPLALSDRLHVAETKLREAEAMIGTFYLVLKDQPAEIRDAIMEALK